MIMPGKIEMNRIVLQVNREILSSLEEDLFFVSGHLPVLDIPYKTGVIHIHWSAPEEGHLGISIQLVGEFNDPKWTLITRIGLEMSLQMEDDLISWADFDSIDVKKLYLVPDSVLFLDDHKVDLIDTINRFLDHQKSNVPEKLKQVLDSRLRQISLQYFNSELLPHLLQPLFFRISSQMDLPLEDIEWTASAMQEHFPVADNSPPYFFMQIPSSDLVYFFNHSIHPRLEIKGYELLFVSVEVIGDNKLIFNLKELSNDWIITLDATLELQDNTIYPKVGEIRVEGLDILKKILFGLFRNLLIAQIEKKPVDIHHMFDALKRRIEGEFPFMRIMPRHEIQMDTLLITPDSTEVMVHFEPVQSPNVS